MIINVCAVLVTVRAWNWGNLIVKDFAFSMEIVHFPLALVSDFSVRVEQGPKSVHLVLQPLAVIFAAINVKECSQTVSFIVFILSNILSTRWIDNTPDFVLLRNLMDILFFWHVLSVILWMGIILLNEDLASSWVILRDKRFSHFASFFDCAQMMIMTIVWRLSFGLLYRGSLTFRFLFSYFRGLLFFLLFSFLKCHLLFRLGSYSFNKIRLSLNDNAGLWRLRYTIAWRFFIKIWYGFRWLINNLGIDRLDIAIDWGGTASQRGGIFSHFISRRKVIRRGRRQLDLWCKAVGKWWYWIFLRFFNIVCKFCSWIKDRIWGEVIVWSIYWSITGIIYWWLMDWIGEGMGVGGLVALG